jgi:PilZ domain
MSGSLPNHSVRRAAHDDRRRDRRYQVELGGELRFDDQTVPVRIADLSVSGALLYMADPPPAGTNGELLVEDFGPIRSEIVHCGDGCCGVRWIDFAAHRDRLLDWLREEVERPAPAASKT